MRHLDKKSKRRYSLPALNNNIPPATGNDVGFRRVMSEFSPFVKKYLFIALAVIGIATAYLLVDLEPSAEQPPVVSTSSSPSDSSSGSPRAEEEKKDSSAEPSSSAELLPADAGEKAAEEIPKAGIEADKSETVPQERQDGEHAAAEKAGSGDKDEARDAEADKTGEDAESDTLTRSTEGTKEVVSGTVEQGDTAAKLLGGDVHDILQVSRKHHSLANIRSGQPYTVVRDRETRALQLFEYEIDAQRKLVVENDGEGFVSRVEPIAYDIHLALLQGNVESSLFQSVAALGESPSLAIVVADVFRWDVDFIKDVQDGDSFSILVEKRFRDGQFRNYGRVLGATFTNKGKLFEAFLFRGVSGFESHYNKKGESLKKVLLKAPLAFTRITSGYSKGRRHPIFHDVRPHEGVDYGAPTGTPIKAVGDGVVTQRGWKGGYGNTVTLRHGAGLESQYGHMSGYARGMSVGARVRQGQVIGFVGATGYATGPHLDFRLKQGGRFINPTKAINPREESIAQGRMAAFNERIEQVRDFLSGATPLESYNPVQFK